MIFHWMDMPENNYPPWLHVSVVFTCHCEKQQNECDFKHMGEQNSSEKNLFMPNTLSLFRMLSLRFTLRSEITE